MKAPVESIPVNVPLTIQDSALGGGSVAPSVVMEADMLKKLIVAVASGAVLASCSPPLGVTDAEAAVQLPNGLKIVAATLNSGMSVGSLYQRPDGSLLACEYDDGRVEPETCFDVHPPQG